MLAYLHIHNIGLMDDLEIDFSSGLNVLTGETGAGKSMIIGSLQALLGGKFDKQAIRRPGQTALIEAQFLMVNSNETFSQVSENDLLDWLKERAIEVDETLILQLRISDAGRSAFKLNGQLVSRQTMVDFGRMVVDIYSQREHQALFDYHYHQLLLDRYCGRPMNQLLDELSAVYQERLDLLKDNSLGQLTEAERQREIDFLTFEIQEIEAGQLVSGEDDCLEAEYELLQHSKEISEGLQFIETKLSTDSSNRQILAEAEQRLKPFSGLDQSITSIVEQLQTIDALYFDLQRDVSYQQDVFNYDEEKLYAIEKRLDLINQLKMKYGLTIDKVLSELNKKQQRRQKLLSFEEASKQRQRQLDEFEGIMGRLANQISSLRQQQATVLEKAIESRLKCLNLGGSKFIVNISKRTNIGRTGDDKIEFLISTNQGEDAKPLAKVASGGEMSRIMLAIKQVLADVDQIDSLIFDEVDAGISGVTADIVGDSLASLAMKHQVICITHLPQIACKADHHYLIRKETANHQTVTAIEKLERSGRVEELSRLLGGNKITASIIEAAEEMLM